MKRINRVGLIPVVLVAIALIVLAWPWIEDVARALLDRDRVLAWLSGFGAWAPLAFIAISFVQVVIAPIPGQFIGVAGGYLFGLWGGLLYGLVGTTLGAGLNMWLGRRFGRPLVTRLAGESALARFDRFADRRGPLFFFLVFLLPFVPDDLACYAVGLSRLPILPVLIMATVVRVPAGIVSVIVGDNIANLSPGLLVAALVAIVLTAALVWKYQERLEALLMRWISRRSRVNGGRAQRY